MPWEHGEGILLGHGPHGIGHAIDEPLARRGGTGKRAVLNRLDARGAMTDHHHTAKAQEHRTALRITTQLALEATQNRLHEKRGDLPPKRGHEAALELLHHELSRALNGLKGDIAGKAIANDDIEMPTREVSPLAVAREAFDVLGHKGKTRLRERAPFMILGTVGKETHARPIDTQHTGRAYAAPI